MDILTALLLFFAAMLGGGLNSVAGGGSFVTLPSLIFAGIPPVAANATSTVALWPGALASIGAYRRELAEQRQMLLLLSTTSIVGGILGAVLLLFTSDEAFVLLLPYLLLVATVLFTFGGRLTTYLRKRIQPPESGEQATGSRIGTIVLQFIISIYGGFFGGGMGIMLLATLALMGMDHMHSMNALKNALAALINGLAVVTFVIAGIVAWVPALVMVAGSIIGGYGAGAIARRLDPVLVRRFVIVVGFGMTLYFFLR